MADSTVRHIVVGFDGSECSAHALGWALQLGASLGADVAVVSAWRRTVTYDAASLSATFLSDDDLAAVEQTGIDEALQRFSEQVDTIREAGLEVVTRVVEGDAVDVLMASAAEADLLVLGRRGHQGFGTRLLGSTSRHLADHAPCSVVVVPEQIDR